MRQLERSARLEDRVNRPELPAIEAAFSRTAAAVRRVVAGAVGGGKPHTTRTDRAHTRQSAGDSSRARRVARRGAVRASRATLMSAPFRVARCPAGGGTPAPPRLRRESAPGAARERPRQRRYPGRRKLPGLTRRHDPYRGHAASRGAPSAARRASNPRFRILLNWASLTPGPRDRSGCRPWPAADRNSRAEVRPTRRWRPAIHQAVLFVAESAASSNGTTASPPAPAATSDRAQ